jgi:hypothetical protein
MKGFEARQLRLRLVIVQETPGIWLARGLEHDVVAEARSIGGAVRAAVGFVQAHTAFDRRHQLAPLTAFPPAPPNYWNAYSGGTALSLTQLGVTPPTGWDIRAAVAHRDPYRHENARTRNHIWRS